MLLVANFCWGLSFPLIKSVLLLHERIIPEAGTWFSAIYTVAPRFFLAFLVLLALKPLAWRGVTRGELKQGLVFGLFASAGMLLQNDALQFTALVSSVLVLLAACPSGVNVMAFARSAEDSRSVSAAISLSTLLAAVSLPLWMLLVGF